MKKEIIYIIVLLSTIADARNLHRPHDSLLACLEVRYVDQQEKRTLYNSHLQEHSLFHLFDKEHFFSRQLPNHEITYRYDSSKTVDPAILAELNEKLIDEIAQGKKKYTDFTILKDRDFRKKMGSGALILKYKNYPFVLKLFVETPESFTQPFSKGFEPTVFFLMGDGINRHLNGFTRLKNLEFLQARVIENPEWTERIDFPRKWVWVPKNHKWLELSGYNIGGPSKKQKTEIPAIYGVVCDEIQIDRVFSLNHYDDRTTILNLSNYLGQHIDPHIKNYVYEKGTNKIVPIDSEHFLTMVGMDKPNQCDNYPQWYFDLAMKMLRDTYGRTKSVRREHQFKSHTQFGECDDISNLS